MLVVWITLLADVAKAGCLERRVNREEDEVGLSARSGDATIGSGGATGSADCTEQAVVSGGAGHGRHELRPLTLSEESDGMEHGLATDVGL